MGARGKPNSEHVVCHSGDKPDGMAYALECLHCGQIQKIVTPMSADLYITLGKAFVRLHKNCPVTARGLARQFHAHCAAAGISKTSGDFGAVHLGHIRTQTLKYALAAGISEEELQLAIEEEETHAQ